MTEITVTGGATEALFATLTALVHPGDEVVLLQPAYDSYAPAVRLSGGTPVFVTLRAPDYRVDWDEVRRAITARTRAIVINSPHNPTGTTLESLARHPALADRGVVIGSFGKTFHATGWKVGWAAAPRALSAEVQSIHQWVTFAVNGAVQLAYAEFIRQDPECRTVAAFYQRKRDLFRSLLAGSRFTLLPCKGTFFQMVDYSSITSERDADFAMRLLKEHGVASIPPSSFLQGVDSGPMLRFCFAKLDETLERAAARLRQV
jgi:methionine aminotransferase